MPGFHWLLLCLLEGHAFYRLVHKIAVCVYACSERFYCTTKQFLCSAVYTRLTHRVSAHSACLLNSSCTVGVCSAVSAHKQCLFSSSQCLFSSSQCLLNSSRTVSVQQFTQCAAAYSSHSVCCVYRMQWLKLI